MSLPLDDADHKSTDLGGLSLPRRWCVRCRRCGGCCWPSPADIAAAGQRELQISSLGDYRCRVTAVGAATVLVAAAGDHRVGVSHMAGKL